MYIEPNTNIRILHNCPIDNTYEHTLYFASSDAQYNYFVTLQKYNLTNYSYQRVQRGWMRVGIKADNLYDCNYLMFQNTSFGNKWFYAFINSVEYINNVTAEIEFEIDVMQTWMFDYSIDYCFVEREHVANDAIGLHIEPEPVDTGEYVYNEYDDLEPTIKPLCVIMAIVDQDAEADSHNYNGVYGGATLYAYNLSDVESINDKITSYSQKPDSIVAMYMCPVLATQGTIPTGGEKLGNHDSAYIINGSADAITTDNLIDGHKPRNNKLYTYPYNFWNIDNANGSSLALRYEFFDEHKPQYYIGLPETMPVEVLFRPHHYKGSGDKAVTTESLKLSNYPMCSWSTDAFRAWCAQNTVGYEAAGKIATGAVSGAIAGSIVPGVGNLVGALTGSIGGALSTVTNGLLQGYKASISADIVKGSINSGSGNVAVGTQSFRGGRMSITNRYAQMIDDFFDRFGYQVNQLKVPNTHTRPHWNYVKTGDVTLTGSIPADDCKQICNIYRNGITFWMNGSEVGQYGLDNSPT